MQGFPNIGVISECAGGSLGRPAPHVSRGCFGSNMVAVVRLLNSLGRLSHKIAAAVLQDLLGFQLNVALLVIAIWPSRADVCTTSEGE